jgi:hypothetical protein
MARWAAVGLVTLVGFLTVARPTPAAADPITWTELGPSGLIARAITTAATCPLVRLDWRLEPMQVRAEPTAPDFPVLVCEATVPPSTRFASIDGQRLPLFRPGPRRIVVIGDAGCRIEGTVVQACNDPTRWPFAEIARRAAAWRPDLVIHVGDYIYRADPCPPGNEGCAGSPHGDNWAALQADLFTPAAPLLRAAPWVFVRGNHETCARGGEAWFRFLYPLARPPSCLDLTEPYKIALGGHVHLFETLSFGPGRPPQMVVGNSGTALAPPVETPLAGLEIAGREVVRGLNVDRFGFVTMQQFLGVWTAALRDVGGTPIVGCALLGPHLNCRPAGLGLGLASESDAE